MSKYYLDDENSETCHPKDHFTDKMFDEELSEITVFEAVRDVGSGVFYCREHGEVGDSGDANCGKECNKYKPRNGRSGICKSHSPSYRWGKKVTMKSNGKVVNYSSSGIIDRDNANPEFMKIIDGIESKCYNTACPWSEQNNCIGGVRHKCSGLQTCP
jgi:hypothetical protein